jgi:hypothetical protein
VGGLAAAGAPGRRRARKTDGDRESEDERQTYMGAATCTRSAVCGIPPAFVTVAAGGCGVKAGTRFPVILS